MRGSSPATREKMEKREKRKTGKGPKTNLANLANLAQARCWTDRATLRRADAALATLKHRISLAALACLRSAPDAAVVVQRALHEVDVARAALEAADQGAIPVRVPRRREKYL